jgi:hypothetical protein
MHLRPSSSFGGLKTLSKRVAVLLQTVEAHVGVLLECLLSSNFGNTGYERTS